MISQCILTINFNICGSSLLGDIYVCTIWFYVMAW